jgi:hypothetical protein
VEGSDTLVVMTKAQASAMNNKFVQMKKSIDEKQADYEGMKAIADSLATQSIRNAATLQRIKENLPKAIKESNREWWSRMAFVTWGFTAYILSNG